MNRLVQILVRLPFILVGVFAVVAIILNLTDKPEQEAEKISVPQWVYSPAPIQVHPELQRLWTEDDAVILAKLVWSEARGVSSKMEQAAVIWCVLNRLDDGSWGDTIESVVTCPNQFAWDESAPVDDDLVELAKDVLTRWELERTKQISAGRVLPRRYLYFGAENGRNYFRTDYYNFDDVWQWKLPDPYTDMEG